MMSNVTVKEIVSANAQYKAVILRRKDELFEVITYKWTHEIVLGYGEVDDPFWEAVSGPSLTNDLVIAGKLANEELAAWAKG